MQSAEEFAAERSRRRLIGIAAQFDLPGGRRVNIVREKSKDGGNLPRVQMVEGAETIARLVPFLYFDVPCEPFYVKDGSDWALLKMAQKFMIGRVCELAREGSILVVYHLPGKPLIREYPEAYDDQYAQADFLATLVEVRRDALHVWLFAELWPAYSAKPLVTNPHNPERLVTLKDLAVTQFFENSVWLNIDELFTVMKKVQLVIQPFFECSEQFRTVKAAIRQHFDMIALRERAYITESFNHTYPTGSESCRKGQQSELDGLMSRTRPYGGWSFDDCKPCKETFKSMLHRFRWPFDKEYSD